MEKIIGVIGAGTMGNGIAQTAAAAGYQVILQDVQENFLQKGLDTIQCNLNRSVEKGKLSREEAEQTLGRVQGTIHIEELAKADIVIEAIIENMEIKKSLLQRLDTVCRRDTIFASNTSGLSVTELGNCTNRPSQVIGMHFFNPVPVMKLVEIVRGQETSDETYEVVKGLVEQFGKKGITVQDAPLFAVNRILVPMINEAIFVLAEGTASAEW
jgi:3-hydroxybutyryl-CoA dehydrogenase